MTKRELYRAALHYAISDREEMLRCIDGCNSPSDIECRKECRKECLEFIEAAKKELKQLKK